MTNQIEKIEAFKEKIAALVKEADSISEYANEADDIKAALEDYVLPEVEAFLEVKQEEAAENNIQEHEYDAASRKYYAGKL